MEQKTDNESGLVEAVVSPTISKTTPAVQGNQSIKNWESCPNERPVFDYLHGWKLHFLTISLCLSLFLASLEVSIVSTALVSIADELKNFGESSWIIASYLLTYTGFLIIWSKLSDIWGRKSCLTTAIMIFTIFSGACGGAQTNAQLIIFRAFQGLGGSGMTSITLAILPEMVEPSKYALYSSITGMSFAFSYLLGPLLGAAINDHASWRWVFLINVPTGLINVLILQRAAPTNFPYQLHPPATPAWYSVALLRRLDILGCFLLLGASAFIVACLEEAGLRYKWSSALIITFLTLSGVFWISFLAWEFIVTMKQEQRMGMTPGLFQDHQSPIADESKKKEEIQSSIEPVFPWRFAKNRVFLFMLLCAFSAGVPFTVSVISIPQRLQAVNGLSPFAAGIRLLPFALAVPFGSLLQSVLGKRGVSPVVVLLIGALLQVAGTAPQMKLPVAIRPEKYAEQTVAGVGVGINLGMLILWTPFIVTGVDTAVAMSAITQIRALGGVVGIAIVTNLFNNHLRQALDSSTLAPEAVAALLRSPYAITNLPVSTQETLRDVFSSGYTMQLRAVVAFSVVQVLCVLGMWERGVVRKVV